MSAKSYFERVRSSVRRLHELDLIILEGGDVAKASDGPRPKGHVSDPTAAKAINAGSVLKAAEIEREGHLELIGDALAVIHGVLMAIGGKYAEALEAVYVDDLPVSVFAEDAGISRNTAHMRLRIAFDYIDSVGMIGARYGVQA